MKQLLITGFEPFGGEPVNPSWEAVQLLPEVIGDFHLRKLRLPVVYGDAARTALAAVEKIRPDAVLCIGQAGSRAAVTPEYVAINLRHARIADNAGNHPQDEPVVLGGPAAYFTTVPVRRMVEAVEKTGVPCACSYTAGTFVCNDLIYSLLHALRDTEIPAGFIHVPFLPEQGSPSLTLEQMVAALTAAVSAL